MSLKSLNQNSKNLLSSSNLVSTVERLKVFILKRYSFISYLIVGALSSLLYFGLFALLWQFIKIDYKTSVSIAYIFAILFHFSSNRRFSFKAHGTNLFKHITKYAFMISINYFITMACMYIIVEMLHHTPYAGVIFGILINIGTNFLMSRYWVFSTTKAM